MAELCFPERFDYVWLVISVQSRCQASGTGLAHRRSRHRSIQRSCREAKKFDLNQLYLKLARKLFSRWAARRPAVVAMPDRDWETRMKDPFLNYFALGLLFFVVIVLVYGIIAIHDIPARIAKARHHPHEDAIHAAGWISLFMLHLLWPFLWIWAMMYRPDRGWGFAHKPGEPSTAQEAVAELENLRHRLAEVEAKLRKDRSIQSETRTRTKPDLADSSLGKGNTPAAEATVAESPGTKR